MPETITLSMSPPALRGAFPVIVRPRSRRGESPTAAAARLEAAAAKRARTALRH